MKTPDHALRTLAILLVTVSAAGGARAQSEGDLDPTFGTAGAVRVDVPIGGQSRTNHATDVAIDADGRIVLAGTAKRLAGQSGEEQLALVRLEPDGALDPTFGSGGRVRVRPFAEDPEIYTFSGGRIEISTDGDLYLLADASQQGPTGWVLTRLGPDGSVDHGFGDGGTIALLDVAVDGVDLGLTPAGGRILVLDDFLDEGAIPINVEMSVTRFHEDGSLDTTFGDGGYAVVGFNRGGSQDDEAGAMLVLSDGRILIAGSAAVGPASSTNVDFAIARLEPDGDLDPTFSGNGLAVVGFDFGSQTEDFARALAVDPQGRILVAGYAGDEVAVARLRANGTPDPGFGNGGRVTFHFGGASPSIVDAAFGLAVQDDGRILVVGRGAPAGGGGMRFGVARLTTTGALDPTFWSDGTRLLDLATGSGELSVGRAAILQRDGRLVAAGAAERAAGDFDFAAARVHLDLIFADGFQTGDTSRW